MDSSTLLDYALFQLTPTRTRCDLVLFYGGKTEKLASGLFEPFISHLKFIKDQISKGGYSIKLCPPSNNAPWFTKGTFERFVRFVSTPAVLERFVSLENEIQQIESSVQANEPPNTATAGQPEDGSGLPASAVARKSSDSTKLKGELEGSDDSAPEENSKIQLQRLLETRKMLLRKEQAMAYARGLVAGFEVQNIDDLISFADAFGALRIREACINFKELCKKKHGDGLWMQELAAMQACPPSELSFMGTSGIVLTNNSVLNQNISLNELLDPSRSDSTADDASADSKKDDNSTMSNQMPSTNAKIQAPMPWPNQMPPYMYNFHTPIQQLPPFQGYPYPLIQPLPTQYSGQFLWPPGMKEPSSVKKEKSRKGSESLEEDITDSSGSEVESDADSYIQQDKKVSSADAPSRNKHRKKSSKTVVIRNINYITPERRNRDGVSNESFSDEDEFIDEDSLKQKVEEAVGSLGKFRKSKTSNHGKKGSHKGNNIANGSDEHDEDFDNASVSNKTKGGKTNDNWDAFQSFLMKDEETSVNILDKLPTEDLQNDHFKERSYKNETSSAMNPAMDAELQKAAKQLLSAGDAFVVNQREDGHEDRVLQEDMDNLENSRPIMRRRVSADEDLVISRRLEESGTGIGGILLTESSTIRPGKGEDWFVIDHSGKPENDSATNRTPFTDDYMLSSEDHSSNADKSKKDMLIDDSFMVHARPAVDESFDSQWRSDMSMEADLALSSKVESENVQDIREVQNAYEPNDLCMVLERDSGLESVRDSWTSEHGIDISFMETEKSSSSVNNSDNADTKLPPNSGIAAIKKNESNGKKIPARDTRSRGLYSSPGKSKTDMMSRTKKPSLVSRPAVQKSKLEKEEEIRKNMEELAIQRQKRIAERTAAAALAQATTRKAASVKGTLKSNTATRETNKTTSVRVRAT